MMARQKGCGNFLWMVFGFCLIGAMVAMIIGILIYLVLSEY